MNINHQWDSIAEERFKHRMAGDDISYDTVFLPTIVEYLKSFEGNDILDFGCGTGELTFEIAKQGFSVTGIDISEHSIQLAKRNFSAENLIFATVSITDFVIKDQFSLVVANMALMDTENLQANLKALNYALRKFGKMIVIITHPSFWPIYWNYASDTNFDYLNECAITKTYKTKTKIFDGFITTHFHRPISLYIDNFIKSNFKICNIKELRNPNDKEWYPRFMFFELEKESDI